MGRVGYTQIDIVQLTPWAYLSAIGRMRIGILRSVAVVARILNDIMKCSPM